MIPAPTSDPAAFAVASESHVVTLITHIYLAGSMTGLARWNFEAFAAAAAALRAAGYIVTSPHEMDLDPASLRADAAALRAADAVALVDGWDTTPGTMFEITVAEHRGIPWAPVRDYLPVHQTMPVADFRP